MQGRIRSAVIASLAQFTGRSAPDIRDTDNLIDDLGVDSLVAVNLLSTIEEKLGILLPEGSEGSLLDIWTVGDLVGRLSALFADGLEPETESVHGHVGADEP
jgi:acyl carrier protein